MRDDEVEELGIALGREMAVMGFVSFSVGVGFSVGEAAEVLSEAAGGAADWATAGEDEVVGCALVE